MSKTRTPLVADIKRNALDDGPGVRSVVFFKGCPLRCSWCQNPEAISPSRQLQLLPERCRDCGACLEHCPTGAAQPAVSTAERGRCQRCGACARACPLGARRLVGRRWSPDELVDELVRDEPFFVRSGGGVTFSGGEATLFPAYAGEVAARLAQRGIHVLLETCGHFDWPAVQEHLLPHLSAVYFDLKLADAQQHLHHTGRDNTPILENLRRLAALEGLELLPRIPLVPGVTDTRRNLRGLAGLVTGLGLERVALLPYNPLWLSKRRGLGLGLRYRHEAWMSEADLARCAQLLEAEGLQVKGRHNSEAATPEPAPAPLPRGLPPAARRPLMARLSAPPGPAEARLVQRGSAAVLAVPGRYCVSYLLLGPRSVTAVDVGSAADLPQILAAMNWLGRPSQSLRQVIPSHLHFDHIMGVDALARRCGAQVLLGRTARQAVAGQRRLRWPPKRNLPRGFVTWLMQGMPLLPAEDWHDGLDFGFPWGKNRFQAPLAPALDHGDAVPGLPGWVLLETPGHADDAVALYHRQARFLVAGDTARNFLGGEWNPMICDRQAFARTRELLQQLSVETLFPAHGPLLQGPRVLWRLREVPAYLP